jgi:hypothetical protein
MSRWALRGGATALFFTTRSVMAESPLFKDAAPSLPDFDLVRIATALIACILVGAVVILILRRRPGFGNAIGKGAPKRIQVLETARVSSRVTVHYIQVDQFRVLVTTDGTGSHTTKLIGAGTDYETQQ